jgi:hypothetical protein
MARRSGSLKREQHVGQPHLVARRMREIGDFERFMVRI